MLSYLEHCYTHGVFTFDTRTTHLGRREATGGASGRRRMRRAEAHEPIVGEGGGGRGQESSYTEHFQSRKCVEVSWPISSWYRKLVVLANLSLSVIDVYV